LNYLKKIKVSSNGNGNDTRFGKRPVIVVEARIESRFWTHDTRASIFKLLASIQASSPLNNILFDPKTGFLTVT
jgi:hypothetical protein